MRRLYRSRHQRLLAGVCGGIGQYLGVDANVVRLVWIILSLPGAGIPGILAYLICWAVIPAEPVSV